LTSARATVKLPADQIGYLIGKKGNTINALAEAVNCQIHVRQWEGSDQRYVSS